MSILNSNYSVRATTIDVATLDELRDQNFVSRYPPLYQKKPKLIQVQLDNQDDNYSQRSDRKKPMNRIKRLVGKFRKQRPVVEQPKVKISPIMTSCSSFLDMYPARKQSIHIQEDRRSPVPTNSQPLNRTTRLAHQQHSPCSINQFLMSPPSRVVVPPIDSVYYGGREFPNHTSSLPFDCISPANSDFGFSDLLSTDRSPHKRNPDIDSGQSNFLQMDNFDPTPDSDNESYYSFMDSPEEISSKTVQNPYAGSLRSPTTMSNFITGMEFHRGNTAVIKSINSGRIRIANTYSSRMGS